MKKLLFVPLLFTLFACNSSNTESVLEDQDLQVANEVSIFESKQNQKQWVLTANSVDFADLQHAVLKFPKLKLKQEGNDSALISGDIGTLDYQQKKVSIEGHATLISFTENVTISANGFFYDIDKDRVWSNTKTTVVRETAKVIAKGGIETDSKLSKIELKKQTTHLPQNLKNLRNKK